MKAYSENIKIVLFVCKEGNETCHVFSLISEDYLVMCASVFFP